MVLIFVTAFLIRLIALNQSLWLDEATTARVVQQFEFSQIISRFSPNDFHPPLYYLFMDFWTQIFGYSEVSLRFPSIIFSLLAGWAVYLIGKRLVNKRLGVLAAAFFLFNPLIVYYSQEARMYMMATFLLTATLFFLMSLIPEFFDSVGTLASRRSAPPKSQKIDIFAHSISTRTARQIFLFNLFIFLSFLTFYGSVFFIAAIYLYLVIKKQFRLLAWLLPGFVLGLVSVSALLYQQYLNSRQALLTVSNWKLVLGPASFKNLFLIPLKFSVGRISFEPKVLYYLLSGAWTGLIFYFAGKGSLKEKKGQILAAMLIFPIVLGFLFSILAPLLQYFRFIYLIPIMAILLALGTKSSMNRFIAVAGFSLFSLIYLLNPSFHREDWKSLAKSLPNKAKVCMIPSSADPLLYYRKDITIVTPTRCNFGSTVIVVPYTAEIHGVDYKTIMQDKGFRQEKTFNFRQLQYEVWKR